MRYIAQTRICFIIFVSMRPVPGMSIPFTASIYYAANIEEVEEEEEEENHSFKTAKFVNSSYSLRREALHCSRDPLIWKQVTISNPCRECFVSAPRDFSGRCQTFGGVVFGRIYTVVYGEGGR